MSSFTIQIPVLLEFYKKYTINITKSLVKGRILKRERNNRSSVNFFALFDPHFTYMPHELEFVHP